METPGGSPTSTSNCIVSHQKCDAKSCAVWRFASLSRDRGFHASPRMAVVKRKRSNRAETRFDRFHIKLAMTCERSLQGDYCRLQFRDLAGRFKLELLLAVDFNDTDGDQRLTGEFTAQQAVGQRVFEHILDRPA